MASRPRERVPSAGVRSIEAWRAGLLALGLALLTTRGLDTADAAVHLDLAIAFTRGETALSIDPGSLWVPTRPVAGGLFYQDGEHLRSASAPGHAALAVPLVGAASLIAPTEPPRFDALFEGGAPRAVIRPLQRDPRVIAFVLVGVIALALTAAFVARASASLALSRGARAITLAALLLGSPLLAYAGSTWTQLPVTAALAYVLYRLVARERGERVRDRGIGIAAAIAILVRPDSIAFVVVAGLALYRIERGWRRAPSRAVARFLLPVTLAFVALAVWGWPDSGDGWSLARLPEGALGLLASPRTGLLVYSPFVAVALVGVAHLRARARPLATLIVGWLIVALVIYGGWFDWPASLAYGPRFLVPMLPALALALGVAYDASSRPVRALAAASVVLGFVLALPGALLVHARIEEPERFAHPSFLTAWQTLLAGDAVGALGVDCAATYVLAYPVLAVAAALLGIVFELRARGSLGRE